MESGLAFVSAVSLVLVSLERDRGGRRRGRSPAYPPPRARRLARQAQPDCAWMEEPAPACSLYTGALAELNRHGGDGSVFATSRLASIGAKKAIWRLPKARAALDTRAFAGFRHVANKEIVSHRPYCGGIPNLGHSVVFSTLPIFAVRLPATNVSFGSEALLIGSWPKAMKGQAGPQGSHQRPHEPLPETRDRGFTA
jgi:hypothetical protein